MFLLHLFLDALQQAGHLVLYDSGRLLGIAGPDESHVQGLVLRNGSAIGEDLLVQSVRFAYLTFGPVAVNRVFELPFRHTYHHLHPW